MRTARRQNSTGMDPRRQRFHRVPPGRAPMDRLPPIRMTPEGQHHESSNIVHRCSLEIVRRRPDRHSRDATLVTWPPHRIGGHIMLRHAMNLSVALVVILAACKKSNDQQLSSTATGNNSFSSMADRGDDPCIYLASTEAEPYVGPLATPPFRFDDEAGAPAAEGKHCMYRGRDGREIMVDVIA